jgi:RNA polymerase sigma-70 factor (ECF subfamily)
MTVDSQGSDLSRRALHVALLSRVGSLRRYIASKIPPRLCSVTSPDDILQEVWIAAYRTFPRRELDGSDVLDRWLRTVVNRKLIDAIRTARRLKRGGDRQLMRDAAAPLTSFSGLFERLQSPHRTPSTELAAIETSHAVLISLHGLSSARRQAIKMRFMEGLSRKEIAQRMGRSEAAVSGLLFHGLRQLRGMLGDAAKYFSDTGSSEPGHAPAQSDA